MPITSETLRRLAEFDTPTICNVIEWFDVCPRDAGFMDGRIRAAFSGDAADGRIRGRRRLPQLGPAG